MVKALNQILKVTLCGFIIILPSFVLTFFTSPFDFSKVVLMVVTLAVCLAVFAFKLIYEGKFELNLSKVDLPLLLLVLAYIVSAVVRTPNKMEAFVNPGPVTVIIAGFLLYLFVKMAFKSQKWEVANTLLFSGVLVSILSIFAYTGLLGSVSQLSEVIKRPEFSPLGGKLPEMIFLVCLLPIAVSMIIRAKESAKKVLYSAILFVIGLSLILSTTLVLPGKPGSPIIANYQTSWSVAVDTLKVSPLFGVGPGNYLTAFSRFLPLSYNSTPIWANRFLSASSFLMTLITETGVIGFVAFLFVVRTLLKKPLKNIKTIFVSLDKEKVGYIMSLLILTASFVLLPASLTLVVLFYLLIYLNSDDTETIVNLSATSIKEGNVLISKGPSIVLAVMILGLNIYMFLFATRVLSAERSYKKAVDAILANDAKTAYSSLRDAIAKNTYVDRYHASQAQLNLALARSISQKTDITDTDRNTIAQLVQQAINEAKTTVSLNSGRSANWETLARTYQSIIPLAQGADNFTITSYNQAIALDPINPNLRVSLGGVYYSLKRYDEAINAFGLAVTAKPDLANAHYNLAIAYREKKDYEKAINEMEKVLNLIESNSKDYELAQKTLEEIRKAKPTTPATGTENLIPPQPQEQQVLNPPLELPEEATPPVSPP